LYTYYGHGGAPATAPADGNTAQVEGYDTSGPTTDDAMTRSEEQLHVGTERVETGRARLRKYVVTEQETVSVPVSHEEVRLEREPITDGNVGDALDGPDISEEEHEVVLTEERPVIAKETVPVERVRIGTETKTDTEQVSAEVRKEEIELEDDTTHHTDR
uniref:YsnF/AvaK domain-containing protein n=2 Tax=Bacillati TaxID=1783272 RepID=UPI0030C8CB2A